MNRAIRKLFPVTFLISGMVMVYLSKFSDENEALISLVLGTSITTVGFLLILLPSWIENRFEKQSDEINDYLFDIKQSIQHEKELSSLSTSGITKVYINSSKALSEISSVINKTKQRVDIMGTTLVSILRIPDFEIATEEAIERMVRFRILILDPKSKAVDYLAQQENRDRESIFQELLYSLDRWKMLSDRLKERDYLEIRLYDSPPGTTLIITDDLLQFTPNLYMKSLYSLPTFEVKRGIGHIYDAFLQHFDLIWSQESNLLLDG